MVKRLTALLLICCLLFATVPVFAGAVDGQQVTANAVTVTAGNTTTLTLKAENFNNIATLDVYVYYDAQAFTVSRTNNGSILSGAQSSVNTAEMGTVKLSAMALNGINGSGTLLTINFATKSDCAPGTYPITVAIGRAYDGDLKPTTINGVNGSISVNKPVETETFSIYSYTDKTTLQKGDTLSYRVASSSSSRAFVSGEFTVEYDHEVFAFDSVVMESALTGEGAVYSVNSSVLGKVRIAYASVDPVKSYYLFTVKLTVIADKSGTTTLKAQAANMYRENLTMYLPGSTSKNITLQKLPETVDYPNAFFQTDRLVVGKQSNSLFCLEAGAGVAAADFTLTYDPTVLRCVSVTAADGLAEKGGMVVVNDNVASGTIRFSYVNMSAYNAEDLPLVQITWEPIQSPESHYTITSGAVGVVDAWQNAVLLEHIENTSCIYHTTVIEVTCTENGYTIYTCACGDTYKDNYVDATGHKYTEEVTKAPTCTEKGEKTFTCNCGETYTEEIAAKGHTASAAATCIKAQICTVCMVELAPATGVHIYDNVYDATCNTCDHIREAEIAITVVDNRVSAIDNNVHNKNHRILVFKLGEQTVADPYNWNALTAIDSKYTVYNGLAAINAVELTQKGNYVIWFVYEDATGAKQTIALTHTVVADSKPMISVVDNKISAKDTGTSNRNHRILVFKLGNKTVADPYNWGALTAIDGKYAVYNGLAAINAVELTQKGNYVIWFVYEDATGTKQTIALTHTVITDSKPMISVVDNKVVATDSNANNQNHRILVFKLGEQTVADPYNWGALTAIDSKYAVYNGLAAINAVELTQKGNYVIWFVYEDATGTKQTIALTHTVITDSKPMISVVDNKIVAKDTGTSNQNHRILVFKLGEQTVADPYNWGALTAIDGKYAVYNGLAAINAVELTQKGNYVIWFVYEDATGTKQTIALTHTVVADSKPMISVVDNKVVATDSNANNQNHRILVFKLGDKTVADPYNWGALTAIDGKYAVYNGLAAINAVELTQKGNYVIWFVYEDATGTKQTIALTHTVVANNKPMISVVDNKVVATDSNANNQNHRILVFKLGDKTVADPYNWNALTAIDGKYAVYNGLAAINAVELTQKGNYVIWFVYEDATGTKQTIAVSHFVD